MPGPPEQSLVLWAIRSLKLLRYRNFWASGCLPETWWGGLCERSYSRGKGEDKCGPHHGDLWLPYICALMCAHTRACVQKYYRHYVVVHIYSLRISEVEAR